VFPDDKREYSEKLNSMGRDKCYVISDKPGKYSAVIVWPCITHEGGKITEECRAGLHEEEEEEEEEKEGEEDEEVNIHLRGKQIASLL
jgi:hypothetical protein